MAVEVVVRGAVVDMEAADMVVVILRIMVEEEVEMGVAIPVGVAVLAVRGVILLVMVEVAVRGDPRRHHHHHMMGMVTTVILNGIVTL